ncbi:hypothetical protein KCH_54440 [Kitasatospora cheerisanensis KCTC 2395]|uniref:Uncharacterized protein n=1 Tax=Kitasatospora cheerisanensis KCTC 2395 TaxID=1348663 RepID=A0A066YY43_9ACTN|nr:hypothetical protein KCH_54440 [Kitasatospora cheerisanensis KCTC 2395]
MSCSTVVRVVVGEPDGAGRARHGTLTLLAAGPRRGRRATLV